MTDNGFSGATWRKSSASNNDGNCVEVAMSDAVRGVRDSKDRDGAVLVFGMRAWSDFLDGVRTGRFD